MKLGYRTVAWDLRGVMALGRLARAWPTVSKEGAGRRVLVIPGYGTSDRSTLALRRYLARLGWEVHGWGQGINSGAVRRHLPPLEAQVTALGSVRIVGWSLGGIFARELARRRPAQVARVVTLGSPIVGGPRHTFVARRMPREVVDDQARRSDAREEVPVPVPVLSLYTRRDGVVAWHASVDPNPGGRSEEVLGTHLGLVLEPTVLARVAAWLREEVALDGVAHDAQR